jgi:hypothetical protein
MCMRRPLCSKSVFRLSDTRTSTHPKAEVRSYGFRMGDAVTISEYYTLLHSRHEATA